MKKVAVIMGSDSDLPVVAPAIKQLRELSIETEVHVMSAHRTPKEAMAFAESARENGFGVILAAAGMAPLGGVLAASTTLPVIGIPCSAKVLDGMDAMLATVMMPPGIPVATVGVNAAKNAALLAAELAEPPQAAREAAMQPAIATAAMFFIFMNIPSKYNILYTQSPSGAAPPTE